jgi:CheY-like chemotaxis protein
MKECVELFVSDTGSGIPKDKLSLIFNRFEKLNDSIQGTGLGLYICKSLVDRLGGKIEVSSELGKGSTFSVFLHQQVSIPTSLKREKKIILAVEDSPEDFHLLNDYLNHEYSVLFGDDEETILHKFMCDHPDLVLVNMKLEKVSSVNIIECIRKISASVPVIAVTEHIHYTDQQRAFQAGCNEVVSKSYSFSRLKETIDSFLKDG